MRHSHRLPAFLFSQFADMRGVVSSVPFVEEKEPINGPFAMLRMYQNTREMLRHERPPQTVPAGVHRLEKSL